MAATAGVVSSGGFSILRDQLASLLPHLADLAYSPAVAVGVGAWGTAASALIQTRNRSRRMSSHTKFLETLESDIKTSSDTVGIERKLKSQKRQRRV